MSVLEGIMPDNLALSLTPMMLVAILALLASGWGATRNTPAGEAVFKSNCAQCHGVDGAGTAAGRSLNVADLRSRAVQDQSDAQLEEIVKNGKENMPAFNGTLSDQQIAEVVAHVRTLQSNSSTGDR